MKGHTQQTYGTICLCECLYGQMKHTQKPSNGENLKVTQGVVDGGVIPLLALVGD
jgi:hypothetical protein